MLTISKPLNTGQAHSYHEQEFANADQNYYSRDTRATGEWQGELALEWGLAGGVTAEHFHRLAEGQHPFTGEQLVQHRFRTEHQNKAGKTVKAAEHRAGWDATFSAPKSVSITALVGGDEQVREAHRQSVEAALDELERFIQARIGGNHPAETTGKMVAAKFEHDSARPVNGYAAPQLHTHVVIFNVTVTSDGKAHALQPHELYKSQQYATAIYRAELAARLRELGYELERGANGEFEIKGYTREYLEASSPRRKQIKQYLETNKVTGAEAAEIGAHRTREKKIHLTPREIERFNLALAAQYGNDPKGVVGQAVARQAQAEERIAHRHTRAQEALTYARDRNIEREAVVEERSLLRDALKRAMGEVTLQDIRANLETRIEKGELLRTGNTTKSSLHRSFTTTQMLVYEQENIAAMKAGQALGVPLVPPDTVRGLKAEFRNLNEAQRKAVIEILASHDRITGLQGVAGSGKTTVLISIRRAAEHEGYKLRGFAPTSRAAHRLEEAGIVSTTLQHFLIHRGAHSTGDTYLYVLDESSLASTKQVYEFFKRLGPHDRVLLVGDIRQHQAVEAGRPFQQMQEAGMRTARLDQIVRQQDPELKRVIESLALGEAAEAVDLLNAQQRIHEVSDAAARLKAMALDFLRHPETSLVVSPDNRSRLEINRHIHQSLQREGKVSPRERQVTVLVNRHELTGADRQWVGRYEPQDVIRYTRGSAGVGVKPGEYATVVWVHLQDNLLTVRRANGWELTYDPRRLQGVNVFQSEERCFSEGDRIQFTRPFEKHHVANRELGHVEKLDSRGNLGLRLDSGRVVKFNIREHPHLDYGYAMTSYSSQGQTVDRVIVHVPPKGQNNSELIHRRFAYVALSRARLDAQIYTHDASGLAERLSREVSKTAALEVEPFHQSGHFALRQSHQKSQEQAQT